MNKWSKIISFLIVFIFGAWLVIGALSPDIFEASGSWVLLLEGAIAIIIAFFILFNRSEDKVEAINYNKKKKGGKK
jgi:hypothetical protein